MKSESHLVKKGHLAFLCSLIALDQVLAHVGRYVGQAPGAVCPVPGHADVVDEGQVKTLLHYFHNDDYYLTYSKIMSSLIEELHYEVL